MMDLPLPSMSTWMVSKLILILDNYMSLTRIPQSVHLCRLYYQMSRVEASSLMAEMADLILPALYDPAQLLTSPASDQGDMV